MFQAYQSVKDLTAKVGNTIRFTDNRSSYYSRSSEFNFNLNSDYLDRPGGDLDALDNIEFSSDGPYAAGPVNLPGGLGEDVISFGDYKSLGKTLKTRPGGARINCWSESRDDFKKRPGR